MIVSLSPLDGTLMHQGMKIARTDEYVYSKWQKLTKTHILKKSPEMGKKVGNSTGAIANEIDLVRKSKQGFHRVWKVWKVWKVMDFFYLWKTWKVRESATDF